jgi:hypothetical protein
VAARHRQLPTRPGGCLKCLSFQIEAASDETPGGCLSGACSCSTTYGAVQDSARKSVRTELLLDRRHADTEPSLRSESRTPRCPEPLKRVVVTPPPGHPSSEVQLNSTCT